jgi:hypothetical protein
MDRRAGRLRASRHKRAPGPRNPTRGNLPNVVTNLLIGRTVANSGAFSGSLSDVRVYKKVLDDAIAAIAASPP